MKNKQADILTISKKGQVAIFVIIAILIVGAIAVFFVFRSNLFVDEIPAEFVPVYEAYEGCIKQETDNGLELLGTQGGRIDVGEYEPGSSYAPFGSQLNFLGEGIPYWYSLKGNGLVVENVPTKNEMERELAAFVEEGIVNCDFDKFYAQGFEINFSDAKVSVRIDDEKVSVEVDSDLRVSRGEGSSFRRTHTVEVDSKLGKFYGIARSIYEKEMSETFLEEYAIDVLRLYAPVDGVELQCGTKVWKTKEVVEDVHKGLEANIPSIKLKGNYYELNNDEDKYFVVDLGVDESVGMVYSSEWPSKLEITPAEQELMMAEPIGNQEGLGAMGFCYVPYHFVYDLSFPVLIQVYDGEEVFQFPVVVIVDKNVPRAAKFVRLADVEPEFEVCDFAEGSVNVKTFDVNLNPVEADIKYQCLDAVCGLGKTQQVGSSAILNAAIPQCVNGFLIANADGYVEKKQLFSSNSESVAEMILDREYPVEVNLKVGGVELDESETAIVHFVGEGISRSVALPDVSSVKLSEGVYEISVYVYGDSKITVPASTKRQCVEVAKGGIFGLFGATEEQCFDIEIPEAKLDYVLIGGGKQETYIFENDLAGGNIELDVQRLPTVNSLEQLQINQEVADAQSIGLRFE